MIVVSDTSPLCYLVLIGCPDVLQKLYSEVWTTETVMTELCHSEAPELVRVWAIDPPQWLKVFSDPPELDRTNGRRHCSSGRIRSPHSGCGPRIESVWAVGRAA